MTDPYWLRLLIALDLCGNVAMGGAFGETISARVQRASDAHHGWRLLYRWPGVLLAKLLLGLLDWIQRSHGRLAELHDAARARAIVALYGTVKAP